MNRFLRPLLLSDYCRGRVAAFLFEFLFPLLFAFLSLVDLRLLLFDRFNLFAFFRFLSLAEARVFVAVCAGFGDGAGWVALLELLRSGVSFPPVLSPITAHFPCVQSV